MSYGAGNIGVGAGKDNTRRPKLASGRNCEKIVNSKLVIMLRFGIIAVLTEQI